MLEFINDIANTAGSWMSEGLSYLNRYVGAGDLTKTIIGYFVTVALGWIIFLIGRLPLKALRNYKYFRQHKNYVGEFYLFHRPTAELGTDLPRRTRLKIAKARDRRFSVHQENIEPSRTMYKGFGEIKRRIFTCILREEESQTVKTIHLHEFSLLKDGSLISAGYMQGINDNNDPWGIPVVVSSRNWGQDTIEKVLAQLNVDILSSKVWSSVLVEFEDRVSSPVSGSFENPWGRVSDIVPEKIEKRGFFWRLRQVQDGDLKSNLQKSTEESSDL